MTISEFAIVQCSRLGWFHVDHVARWRRQVWTKVNSLSLNLVRFS